MCSKHVHLFFDKYVLIIHLNSHSNHISLNIGSVSLLNDFDSEQSKSNDEEESNINNYSKTSTINKSKNNSSKSATRIRKKGGRPSGSTKKNKKKKTQHEKEATYNLICKYMWEVENTDTNRFFKKDIFERVMEDARQKYELAETFYLPYETVLSRIRRKNLDANGHLSPLLPIEDKIVEIIVCMSKLKRSLKASEALCLINELIDGTNIQEYLIQWKQKMNIYSTSPEDHGKVGMKYWRNFLKRNESIIRSKQGRQFSVDRSHPTRVGT